jgi:ABC-type branched-subunit amino acid transport system substrate-binding protein
MASSPVPPDPKECTVQPAVTAPHPRRPHHVRIPARSAAVLLSTALLLTACGGADDEAAPGTTPSATTGTAAPGTPIKIGNIVDLTGPVPGLFRGARQAMEAFVAKTNAEGGIGGRPLELVTADSKIDCNATRKAYTELAPKVEAFVGNISAIDGCAGDVLLKYPKLPAVFQQLNPDLANIATVLTPAPRPPGQSIGAFKRISAMHPGAIEKLGVLVNTRTAFSTKQLVAGLEAIGGKVAFSREVQIDVQTDYTADVVKMRSSGVKWLSLDGFDIQTIARVLAAAKQQNWRPEVITSAPAYDGNFLSVADPAAAEGVLLPLSTAMFLGEDRAESPGVDAYLTWLQKTHPGAKADLFGAYAWAAGMLYVQARKAAGADAEPAEVVQQLIKTTEFDADGLLAPANPGDQKPATCWLLAEIKDGDYRRLEPDKGFSCEGAEFVPYTGG